MARGNWLDAHDACLLKHVCIGVGCEEREKENINTSLYTNNVCKLSGRMARGNWLDVHDTCQLKHVRNGVCSGEWELVNIDAS